ncbi:MAG TPA: hypothetical protein VME46_22725 [Acidimicrobiales bacterium]|nr:hypothetical protein [Acidimicrobiales bacterium]
MIKRWYPAMTAFAACLVCYLAGWRGTDWAAQIYRAGQVAAHGLSLWDPGWYAGMFPLGYSLVYPVLAGYLGLWPVAVGSAVASSYCFDALVQRGRGQPRPISSWYFAFSTVVEVAIGQLPTLAAEALGLGCVLCLTRYWGGSRVPGAWRTALLGGGIGLGLLAGLTSPVAGIFVALSLGAWGLSIATDAERALFDRQGLALIALAFAVVAATIALPLLFAAPGFFPFLSGDLVAVLGICTALAGPWLRAARPIRFAAVLYALASVVFFFVPTTMGDNDTRFAAYVGVPLVIYYLPGALQRLGTAETRRRFGTALGGVVTVIFVGWNWAPMVNALGAAPNGAFSRSAFYRPLIDELNSLSRGLPVRVEIPPTEHHWESAYVAPYFPLARGWERQLDIAYDPLFYETGALGAGTYRHWLLGEGVSYVALANAPLDYASTAEAALLKSGTVPGLVKVWRTQSWTVWKVQGSPGLASGAARVSSFVKAQVQLRFSRAGKVLLRVRWSDLWSLLAAPAGRACLAPGPDGWTTVSAAHRGTVALGIAAIGANHGQCGRFVLAGSQRSG